MGVRYELQSICPWPGRFISCGFGYGSFVFAVGDVSTFPEDAPLASGGTRQLAEPGNGRMIDLWPNQGVGVHGVCERGNPIGAGRPYV